MTHPFPKKTPTKASFKAKALFDYVGLPEKHRKCRLNSIPRKCPHRQDVVKYVNNIVGEIEKGRGLLLHGEYGTGKSGSAAICLKAALSHGMFGYWLNAKRLPDYIINKVRFNEEETIYERCLTVPLLVIDEFQLRKTIAFTETSVEDLIRLRVDASLATVITTNTSLRVLKDDYPALYSILTEAVLPLKIQGHNFRLKGSE